MDYWWYFDIIIYLFVDWHSIIIFYNIAYCYDKHYNTTTLSNDHLKHDEIWLNVDHFNQLLHVNQNYKFSWFSWNFTHTIS